MKKIKKVIPILAPVVAAGTVAWGAASSLGGYTTPVYGSDDFKIAAGGVQDAEPLQAASRQKSGEDPEAPSEKEPKEDQKKDEAAAAKGDLDLADGSYEGTGTGFNGPVKVSVKIQDRAMAAIDVVSHSDDEAFFNRAKEGVIQAILQAQSADVDVVSGATYSSKGIISAVKNALSGGGGSAGASGSSGAPQPTASAPVTIGQGNFDVADGTYEGSADGFHGTVRVSVKVQDKTIQAIDIVSHADDAAFFDRAKTGVVGSILSSQSLDVDVVSGATYSSKGIINAVKNALAGQGGSAAADTPAPTQTPVPVNTPKPAKDPGAYKDGTYTGTGTGFAGKLTVQVKISGGKIKKIKIVRTDDDPAYIEKASALIKRIIKEQGTDVDVISGATYSSTGIIEAVRDALGRAAVPTPEKTPAPTAAPRPTAAPAKKPAGSGRFPYPDGSYTGIGEGFGGDIAVTVVIRDKSIKEIRITSHEGEDDAFFDRAKMIADKIVQEQDIAADAVSGATYSSQGILEGVRNAIEAAKRAALPASPTPVQTPAPTPTPTPTAVPTFTPEATPTPDPISAYIDGDHKVTVPCVPDEYEDFDAYDLTLTLIMENDKITGIRDITGNGWPDNDAYITRAAKGSSLYPGVVSQILEKNSVEGIDTVTRATCSSQSIIEACRQALEAARRR